MQFRFLTLGVVALMGAACTNEPSTNGPLDGGGETDAGPPPVTEFIVGGSVSGLLSGTSVTIENIGEQLTISSNKSFAFEKKVKTGATYAVTVARQPNGQECTVDKRTGTMSNADVTEVAVNCEASKFELGGTITGIEVGQSVLVKNGADSKTLTGPAASFTLPAPVAFRADYDVKVEAVYPLVCSVENGQGSMGTHAISNVAITCSTKSFVLGGTVNGLDTGKFVVLKNGDETLPVLGSGAFTFTQPIADKAGYDVSILTQPFKQSCTMTGGQGMIDGADATGLVIDCADLYSVGGLVTGLGNNKTLELQSDGGEVLTLKSSGAFAFTAFQQTQTPYAVTIKTQPAGQICSLTNDAGTINGADVTNIAVKCLNLYFVGGTLGGLTGGTFLEIENNGDVIYWGVPVGVIGGQFSFPNIPEGTPYDVKIKTFPVGQTCTVSNGKGIVGGNIINIGISCATGYAIGGAVGNLNAGNFVELQNGSEIIRVDAATPNFTFTRLVGDGGTYAVSVKTQPAGQICVINNGSGTVVAADVTTVNVSCVPGNYPVSVKVHGLTTGISMALTLDSESKPINADGTYSFTTQLPYNTPYTVGIDAQPISHTCTFSNNATGNAGAAGGTDIQVDLECELNPWVLRIGDSTGPDVQASPTPALPVYIDEYRPTGALGDPSVRTMVAGSVAAPISVIFDSSYTDSAIARSGDGHSVTFAGYGAAPGTGLAAPTTLSNATAPRCVGQIDAAGNFTRPVCLTDILDKNEKKTWRSAVTNDGSAYWMVGSGGLTYATPGATISSPIDISLPTMRFAHIINNTLWLSIQAGWLQSYGATLPTTTTAAISDPQQTTPAPLKALSQASDYALFDNDPAIPDLDLTYLVVNSSSGNGNGFPAVQKFTKTWDSANSRYWWTQDVAFQPKYPVGDLSQNYSRAHSLGVVKMSAGYRVYLTLTDGLNSQLAYFIDDGVNKNPTVKVLARLIANAGATQPKTIFRGLAIAPTP